MQLASRPPKPSVSDPGGNLDGDLYMSGSLNMSKLDGGCPGMLEPEG